MKSCPPLFNLFLATLLSGMLIPGCKTNEPDANPVANNPSGADTITVADLDNFSDHLQFLGATKKPGKSPAAPAGSSLKISIRDTLRLIAGVYRSIKFLHRDTNKNVAGAYVQVQGMGNGGSLATYFYDVPEVAEVAEDSDTVSVIPFGFDPLGLGNSGGVPPAGTPPNVYNITITPYDETGQPLDETTVPVSIPELNDDPKGSDSSGECGLVNEPGEWWEWDSSFIPEFDANNNFVFWSDPNVVYGANGKPGSSQLIKGCCYDGVSTYSDWCLGDPKYERTLQFPTYYQINSESINFSDNGTFTRITVESKANPNLDKSDFCSGGTGAVTREKKLVTFKGNWTMAEVTVPQDLKAYGYTTRNNLTLRTTTSTGSGVGNAGGIVHQLTCDYLMLIQLDREGGGQHVYRSYVRKQPNDEDYYAM